MKKIRQAQQKRYTTNLRVARILRGFSQDDLAGRIGVDPAIISRIERGVIRGTPEQRKRLVQILKIPKIGLFPEGKVEEISSRDLNVRDCKGEG